MNGPNILIKEKCGSLGDTVTYSTDCGQNIVRLCQNRGFSRSIVGKTKDIFRDIFLPFGFPDTVSEDYFDYQIWDTLQAFCSTITGTFTTQAVLKGVGVGNAEATPLAAAITWVVKDGTGMLGRILFAWLKGNSLDSDCKKWRLFADILNDTAMILELSVPYMSDYSMQVLCLTTTMKAIVGVAGGATRASITQHQAIKGNMADVSAKDGSQETMVNLLASIVGVLLLAFLNEERHIWAVFGIFTIIHLLTNYKAVGSLVFKHLNSTRFLLLVKTYLKFNTVSSPRRINNREPLLLGFGPKSKDLCGFKIKLGCSLKNMPRSCTVDQLHDFKRIYEKKKYMIIPNFQEEVLYVPLRAGEQAEDVIAAYFHAILVGIALCKYNNVPMDINLKRQLHHITPLIRLNAIMKTFPRNTSERRRNLPTPCMDNFSEYISFELNNFFTALKVNGWNVNAHSIDVGAWRYKYQDKED